MRFLILGLGSVGQRHLINIKSLYKKSIIGTLSNIKDRKLITLSRNKTKNNINSIYDIIVLKNKKEIKQFNPKYVIISNESHLHFKTIIPFLKDNYNVFVEKPLITKFNQINYLKSIIKNSKSISAVGYQTRFNPIIKYIKKILAHNKTINANFNWFTYLPDHRPWQNYLTSYASIKQKGGGVIHSMSHEVDLIYNLYGMPNYLSAFESAKVINIQAEESISSIFKYKNHIVNLNLSFASKNEKRYFDIFTEKKHIHCDLVSNRVIINSYNNKKTKLVKDFKITRNQLFIEEIRNFVNCSDKKLTSEISIDEALKTSSICFNIHDSISKQKIIKIKNI